MLGKVCVAGGVLAVLLAVAGCVGAAAGMVVLDSGRPIVWHYGEPAAAHR